MPTTLGPKGFSTKQDYFYRNSRAFFNVADGAVRSGKTHCLLWRFVVHATDKDGPAGEMMILGRTRDTVYSNVILPLSDMLGPRRVRYSHGAGRLILAGRPVRVVGVNDAQAESKIRGATLAGSYCNELTLFEERAFRQLWDRHSVPGAKMFADTNPDTPFHWLHTGFLQNDALTERDLFRVQFGLDDNPVLSEEYKERLKRAHPPGTVWHRRNILGEWVMAQGAIYALFNLNDHVVDYLPPFFEQYAVGVDYGTATVTTFLLLGLHQNTWYVIKEYYHDAEATGVQKVDSEFSADFIEWIEDIDFRSVDVDPSAASFKLQLRRDTGSTRIYDADNDVDLGIRKVSNALYSGRLKIHRGCTNLIAEMSTYAWDEKAQERGEDKPMKVADHGPDALRYASMRVFGRRRTLRLVG
jgi:PBSX family phage terminase large subunit